MNRAGIKDKPMDALEILRTNGQDQTKLNEEFSVLLIEAGTNIEAKMVLWAVRDGKMNAIPAITDAMKKII